MTKIIKELKDLKWPTKKETIKYTKYVLGFIAVVAVLADIIFAITSLII